jgi:hypothetical protein
MTPLAAIAPFHRVALPGPGAPLAAVAALNPVLGLDHRRGRYRAG